MKSVLAVLLLLTACVAFAGDDDDHYAGKKCERDRYKGVANNHLLLPQYFGERSAGTFVSPPAPFGVNSISVMPFFAEHAIKLSKGVIQIVTSAPGNAFYCIYDKHKKLEAEAIFPTNPSGGDGSDVVVMLSPSPFILRAGQHYLASSADNVDATATNYLFATDAVNFLGWTDTAVITGGHCPDQLLGTAIAKYPQSTPWIVLE